MKEPLSLARIEESLREIFANIPLVSSANFRYPIAQNATYAPDLVLELTTNTSVIRLLVEVKDQIQPRQIHGISAQLEQYRSNEEDVPCVASNFISTRSAELCKSYGINYVDLSGNCLFALPDIYILIKGDDKARREKRELRSLFGLKSSRIIAVLLSDSLHPWPVTQLSLQCKVSLGLVSKVKQKLIDQEYAVDVGGGLMLTRPQNLLDDWTAHYQKRLSYSQSYYTLLSGPAKAEGLVRAMDQARRENAGLMLSGFSAAKWIAPFSKSSVDSVYADKVGARILEEHLDLESVESGANFIIEIPKDDFIFSMPKETSDGLICSSPIQTILDLSIYGERGMDSARHIQQSVLIGLWK